MNDIGYIKEEFKGSMLETNIKYADKDALKNYLYYNEMAVDYHIKEKNPKQTIFFSEAVNLCKNRLEKLTKQILEKED